LSDTGWRRIDWDDIPDRQEFIDLTLALLEAGVSNSDRMRDAIRRQRKLILSKTTGSWSTNPSDRFVNEHAWALEELVVQGKIECLSEKEYRLL
jgi:hypothetical protein